MNHHRKEKAAVTAATGLILTLAGCGQVAFTHAPPNTSVNVALAKKAEAVPTPTPMPQMASGPDTSPHERLTETIADDFTLGNLMMQEEKYSDAIKAYERAVKLDPTFSEAWNHLAICYQNTGQSQKALEAFKKYKMITRQQ